MLDQPDLAAAPACPAPSCSDAVPAANDAAPQALRLTFTGSGAEYFRIWVVNLLLSLATLGIYSAWAKVRRLEYFDRNTQLAGAAFDFRGNPRAVLRGRLLAVALLVAYQYAFGFSLAIGLTVIGVLMLALPFLMRGALRFRLSNTYYRGLAFGFCGSVPGAYRAYLLPIVTFLLPGVVLALSPSNPALASVALLPYLAWPLMHAVMKRYQHAHVLYGGEQSRYHLPARRFWGPYLLASLLALLGIVAGAMLAVGIAALTGVPKDSGNAHLLATFIPLLLLATSGYVAYVMTGPYLQVRIANLAWSNTAFRGIRFESGLKARGFVKLQSVNAVLTLLTLGLYRPFAVVRVYRYRLAHLTLHVDGAFEQLVDTAAPAQAGAAGDGAADFLGVDLSW
jgi:uncharacterized membrane protein YjgN (DUF898 family)